MAELRPANLTCEYRRNPTGIDVLRPRLAWQLQTDDSSHRDQRQTAWQVLVATDIATLAAHKGNLWDSGRVESDQTCQIAYGGTSLRAMAQCCWKVRVWDRDGRASAWSDPASWSIGPLASSDWFGAKWVGEPVPDDWTDQRPYPAAMLRREFSLDAVPGRAIAYASARGLYELHINGHRVGDHVLAPEWTDYKQRAQFQAYDVTELLQAGTNVAAAMLGDGWCCGRVGLSHIDPEGPLRGLYARRPQFLLLLAEHTPQGARRIVVTDDTWHCRTDGPIVASDILDGEVIDARRQIAGWDRPGVDLRGWTPVAAGERHDGELVAQPNEPIRITQELVPVAMTQPQPGCFIFDMGQNMVGWCRLRIRGPAGAVVRLRHAEVLDSDGMVYRDNLRIHDNGLGARQEDTFILAGGSDEVFEPRFTYHGFRYVEITGLARPPELADLTGCVLHSDPARTLEFDCSDPSVTRLMEVIQWTLRGNLISTPNDCPQRDERLGWMGDAQVFAQTACFQFDMAAFFTKWLQDVRDAQADDGRFPDFAPHPFDPNRRFSGNPGWGDAGVIVPWQCWVNYGDQRMLEHSYAAACRWVEFVHAHNPELLWTRRRGHPMEYGDWLNGDTLRNLPDWPMTGGALPRVIYATAFFAHSADLLSRMAGVLGHAHDQARYTDLAARIRHAFCQAFVDADGRIEGDTQAGYALALHFDILPTDLRSSAVQHLLGALDRYQGRLSTGIQSTLRLMLELSRAGEDEAAYRILLNRDIPSWLYMLDHGGTTIWERWDGYVEGRRPSPFQSAGMNSFNHYAIGAVGEWMVRTILGISPDESRPGYRHVIIRPRVGGGLTWAQGAYHSIRGTIRVAWSVQDGQLAIDVSLPPNVTATVSLPAPSSDAVTDGDRPLREGTGIRIGNPDSDGLPLDITSGEYRFLMPCPLPAAAPA